METLFRKNHEGKNYIVMAFMCLGGEGRGGEMGRRGCELNIRSGRVYFLLTFRFFAQSKKLSEGEKSFFFF